MYIVELEPLKERYTDWWHSYLPYAFSRCGISSDIISGESLTDIVNTGTVLDAGSTCYWKSIQLQKIARKFFTGEIKPYTVFFVCDIWFPGIEMIRYMSHLYNIPVFIYGVWHAGSSTNNDFAQPMHMWSRDFEIGFLNLCNGIFVGSQYSKNALAERLLYHTSPDVAESIIKRIYDIGMPLNYPLLQQYSSSEKKDIIVFPHRPDPEKNPDIFIDLVRNLSVIWDRFEQCQFVFCTSKKEYKSSDSFINAQIGIIKKDFPNVQVLDNLTKEDYYRLLGEAKLMVSTTSEENFGYCAVEAMALGCAPLLPNDFSHPELVEKDYTFLYDSNSEMMEKVMKIVREEYNYSNVKRYAEPYSYVVDEWARIMKGNV